MDFSFAKALETLGPTALMGVGIWFLWGALKEAREESKLLKVELVKALDDHRKSLEALLDRYHLWMSTATQSLREIADELDSTHKS